MPTGPATRRASNEDPREPAPGLRLGRVADWELAITRAADTTELAQILASTVASISGFEEVWTWRLDAERHGTLLAIRGVDDGASMLGSMAEPADMAPPSIREDGVPVPLVAVDVSAEPVQLRGPVLRPLRVGSDPRYEPFSAYWDRLQRYGSRGSLLLPIACDGREWGMVAAFSPRPAELNLEDVGELELLAQRAAARMTEIAERERLMRRSMLSSLASWVVRSAAAAPSIRQGLVRDPEALASICDADAVALRFLGPDHALGSVLRPEAATAVLDRAAEQLRDPEAGGVVSGVVTEPTALSYLAIGLGETSDEILAWVRGPRTRSTFRIAQRLETSFGDGEFGEIVHDAVEVPDNEWTDIERDAAAALRDGLTGLQSGRFHQLEQRVAELQRANEEFDAFTHSAAHDLRAPIRGITQNIEFFLEDTAGQIDPVVNEQLHAAVRLTHRMRTLLDDLMRYAEMGESARAPEPIGLRSAVDEAIEMLGPGTVQGAEICVADGVIHADPSGLRQILQNLLGNAINYAEGRAHIELGVTTLGDVSVERVPPGSLSERDPATPVLVVRDQGPGIPATRLDDIFGLFARASTTSPGTGAGLAMCRRVARRHGGDIWAQSREGEGAAFFVVLQPA